MKKLLSALAITGMLSGSAIAMQSSNTIFGVIGVGSTNLEYRLDNGTATLTGSTENHGESALVESHVQKMEGVDRVINHAFQSN